MPFVWLSVGLKLQTNMKRLASILTWFGGNISDDRYSAKAHYIRWSGPGLKRLRDISMITLLFKFLTPR